MYIPPELLHQVFDYLGGGPDYLLRYPARVCSQWRSVVRRHPQFKSQIAIGQYRSSLIRGKGIWAYQLEASRDYDTPFHLTVLLVPPSIASLPHVADHMRRCLSLTFEYVAINAKLHGFMQTLRGCSAPILQQLAISFRPAKRWELEGAAIPTEIIPPDIFGGHAPFLRCLRLNPHAGELFPYDDVPAFAQVRQLELDSGRAESSDFRGICPPLSAFHSLQRLSILGQHFLPPLGVDYSVQAFPHLESLLISRLSDDWVPQIDALDVARLRELAQDFDSTESGRPYLTAFRRCLRGRLHLAVEQSPDPESGNPNFCISVHSPGTAKTLRFCGGPHERTKLRYDPSSIDTTSLGLEALASSVVRLEVACSLAHAATQFLRLALPAVATLVILISSTDCLPYIAWKVAVQNKGPLPFPSLREVILRLASEERKLWTRFPVVSTDVARLIRAMVGPVVAAQTALHLTAPLRLSGACAELAETVNSIYQSC